MDDEKALTRRKIAADEGVEWMEHAIALAYLISCLLLAASFPIVLIRKNQNGTKDVFFAHIQGSGILP